MTAGWSANSGVELTIPRGVRGRKNREPREPCMLVALLDGNIVAELSGAKACGILRPLSRNEQQGTGHNGWHVRRNRRWGWGKFQSQSL